MFKTLTLVALASTLSLAAAQTTCFQCINATKHWDDAAPACVATATAATFDTREECSENDAFATGSQTITIDSNFDFASTASVVTLNLVNTNKEVTVVFEQDLNIDYAYKMTDNGVLRYSYFYNAANAAAEKKEVHINPNITYLTKGVGVFKNTFICPWNANTNCQVRITVSKSSGMFGLGMSFAAMILAFLAITA